jgi:hypothetical protein
VIKPLNDLDDDTLQELAEKCKAIATQTACLLFRFNLADVK